MTLFGIIIAFVVVCNLLNWAEASDIGSFVVLSVLATFAAVLQLFVVLFLVSAVLGSMPLRNSVSNAKK